MSFTVTACFDGGKHFECILNHEIDCSAGYEVCVNDVIFTGGGWDNIRDGGNWVRVWSEDRHITLCEEKIYIPVGLYTTSDLLATINKTILPKFRRVESISTRIDPDAYFSEYLTIYANENVYEEAEKRRTGIGYYDWDRRPLVVPQWSLEPDRNALFEYGGMFVYKDTDEGLERMYNAIIPKSKQKDIKIATFKSDHEYIQPGKDSEIEANLSKDATLQWVAFDYYKRTKIEVSPQIAVFLGLTTNTAVPVPLMEHNYHAVLLSGISMLRNTVTAFYLYADFVIPTTVGSKQDNLLKIVPLFSRSGEIDHTIFESISFVPVQRRRIQQMRFYVKESLHYNEPMEFKLPIVITLFFRLINDK